jgi:glycosyltransferase involved in cell wall biosynthesis
MTLQKIIVIINDFGHVNGGASQVAISTASNLANRSHQVFFFCAVDPIDTELSSHRLIKVHCTNQQDILHEPNHLTSSAQGLWNSTSRKMFKNLLQTLPKDSTIIHVHGWTKALGHSVLHEAIKSNIPIVVTAHDYFLACPNGGFYNYQQEQICKLRALSAECIMSNCDSRSYAHKLWRVARGTIQKNLVGIPKQIKHFIFVSEKSKEILTPYLPEDGKTYLLPNPVETKFSPRIRAEKNKKIYAIGRLSPEKGFDKLALVAKELGLELVIIGEGFERERLENINSAITFTGWLTKDQLFEELANARVVVFSSLLYETQGMVVMEAASRGIPSIVSDVTAAADEIIDYETGILYKTNILNDLKEKLTLVSDDKLVMKLSKNTYENFWKNPFTNEKYITDLEKIYDQMLEMNSTTIKMKDSNL